MENCTEFTTVDGNVTKTIFMRDKVHVAERIIVLHEHWRHEYWYNADNQFHRDDDQHAETRHKNGKIDVQKWYKNGKLHRLLGPAVVLYARGKIIAEWWYKNGKLHRDNDLPAEIHYYKCELTGQMWHKNGKLHRDDDRPASIHYEDGKITEQHWHKYGEHYRRAGPTSINEENGILLNYWVEERDRLDYLDVPEDRRLPPEFISAMRRLPLPVGDAIAWHCEWVWPFVRQ